jgi:hypothetical protein
MQIDETIEPQALTIQHMASWFWRSMEPMITVPTNRFLKAMSI